MSVNRPAKSTILRSAGAAGTGGLTNVAGDYRETQGTLWSHDHRFFFTAENVYKGNLVFNSFFSGKDRGNEALNDGVNLRLPSGYLLDWGNVDFDVNLVLSDAAMKPDGQLFFELLLVTSMHEYAVGRPALGFGVRVRAPFDSVDSARAHWPPNLKADTGRVAVQSSFFIVSGRVRLEERAVQSQWLVQRRGGEVLVLRRTPRNLALGVSR